MKRLSAWGCIGVVILAAAGCGQTTDPFESGLVRPPPFGNTTLIAPDLITPSDPTAYTSIISLGQDFRSMFDRRVNNFVTVNAYNFTASYDDGLSIEVSVNPEFGDLAAAQTQAQHYAEIIGRLPNALRAEIETMWIQDGFGLPGGGVNNILIHADEAELAEIDEVLEETLAHEAVHTSLDPTYRDDPAWLAAVAADDWYISTFASQFRNREDLAESFIPWLAMRYRTDRINTTIQALISQTIPNRLQFFDGLGLDVHPLQ